MTIQRHKHGLGSKIKLPISRPEVQTNNNEKFWKQTRLIQIVSMQFSAQQSSISFTATYFLLADATVVSAVWRLED